MLFQRQPVVHGEVDVANVTLHGLYKRCVFIQSPFTMPSILVAVCEATRPDNNQKVTMPSPYHRPDIDRFDPFDTQCRKCGGCRERQVIKGAVLIYAAFEHWRGERMSCRIAIYMVLRTRSYCKECHVPDSLQSALL
jgi:hypothetical protein